MKLVVSYFCSHTFKDKEIVIPNADHIPRIGETIKPEAIVTQRGDVFWPRLKVIDVEYDLIDNFATVKLE